MGGGEIVVLYLKTCGQKFETPDSYTLMCAFFQTLPAKLEANYCRGCLCAVALRFHSTGAKGPKHVPTGQFSSTQCEVHEGPGLLRLVWKSP